MQNKLVLLSSKIDESLVLGVIMGQNLAAVSHSVAAPRAAGTPGWAQGGLWTPGARRRALLLGQPRRGQPAARRTVAGSAH